MRKHQLVDQYPIPKRFIVPIKLQSAFTSVPRAVAHRITLVILLVAIVTAVLLRQATFNKDVIYMVATICALAATFVIALLYQLDHETENIAIAQQNNLIKTVVSKQQTALDNCYHSYLNHPIHQKMAVQCHDYYSWLKSQKKYENELKQAPYMAKIYAKEDAWLMHIQPFPHLLLYDNFFKTPRGKRLETMGVMMMHNFYICYHYRMLSLHQYFSMAEIREFLPIHRQLINSYTYIEDEHDINALKLILIKEIEDMIVDNTWGLEESLRKLKTMRIERLRTYHIFSNKYEELIKLATIIN